MNVKLAAAALLILPAVLQAQTIRAGLPQIHAVVTNAALTAPVLVSAPSLVTPAMAAYPALMRENGTVVVEYTIDAAGVPQNLHVTQGLNKPTDERVLAAVKQYRYQPGTLNGKVVDFPVRLAVDFKQ